MTSSWSTEAHSSWLEISTAARLPLPRLNRCSNPCAAMLRPSRHPTICGDADETPARSTTLSDNETSSAPHGTPARYLRLRAQMQTETTFAPDISGAHTPPLHDNTRRFHAHAKHDYNEALGPRSAQSSAPEAKECRRRGCCEGCTSSTLRPGLDRRDKLLAWTEEMNSS